MACLFENASSSRNTPSSAPGAYVRRLRIPELGGSDQASKNEGVQQDLEVLRRMKCVDTGSRSIVKTRAFGGSMAANYAVEENTRQGMSLQAVAIVERRKKKIQF